MGSYATTSTISLRLPGFLIGDTTTSDDKGTSVFSSYIDKAETMFNAAVAKRYSLPFTTVPPIARDIAFDIAAYYSIRAFSSRDWPNRNEMLDDFKLAFDELEDIERGEVELTMTDGSLIARRTTGRMQSNSENYDPIFDVDEPTAWDVDETRKSNLEDTRS